jgi:UDP-N-acetylglucosamine/UDP-N-acetylgalactosamine diphosphorylase
MEYQQAFEKMMSLGQQHVLASWNTLNVHQQQNLLAQIQRLNPAIFHHQVKLVKNRSHHPLSSIQPFLNYSSIGNREDVSLGKKKIAEGLMGCLIVAGGQGTRLRFDGPKGMFPITPIKHKSLFQLFAEKVSAAGKQAGRPLLLAIMTSLTNHNETINFFEQHQYFGLDRQQVSFFSQGMLPLLSQEGKLFLEQPGNIAEGPDGNGYSLRHFFNHGIWKQWYEQGVRYLNYVLIDNPLADPFDAELLGYHCRHAADITVKCTLRKNPNEKVGLLVKSHDQVRVVEYSEMPDDERLATYSNGSLCHSCANLSLFCFSMDFIKRINGHGEMYRLPWHLAFKAAKYLTPNGKTIQAEGPMAWKFETFIFDILPLAIKVEALLYPREMCFSPLKNVYGDDSVATVQAAIQKSDQITFSRITGTECSNQAFELAQDFYYPTSDLLRKWKGKSPPSGGYIEA